MKLIIATFLAAHARDTDMTVLDLATDEDWIVCLGETRTVRSGQITCPLRPGRPTTRGECAACRHLEGSTMSDETAKRARRMASHRSDDPGCIGIAIHSGDQAH